VYQEPFHISEADEADLVALADGRLDPARERELTERLIAEPELAAAFEQQQRGLNALAAAAAQASAPPSLRARVHEMARDAERAPQKPPRPWRRWLSRSPR
jgi:anti-sigma factor RsiW